MNLYLISQKENDDYDTYDSAVVCAESAEAASMTRPSGSDWDGKSKQYDDWCAATKVSVKLIGVAVDGSTPGVVCASFNAG